MSDPKPTRSQGDLAETLEMLLDKGVVVNADIAVSVGDTELLGVEVRAAIASFETAAKYGLEFPGGTDMERVERVAGVDPKDAENLEVQLDSHSGAESTTAETPAADTDAAEDNSSEARSE